MSTQVNFQDIVDKIMSISGTLHCRLVMEREPPEAAGDLAAKDPFYLELELEQFLLSLPPGVTYLLRTVFDVANGAFAPQDFLDAYITTSNRYPRPSRALDKMIADLPYLVCRLDYGFGLLHEADVTMDVFDGTWTLPDEAPATNNHRPANDQ